MSSRHLGRRFRHLTGTTPLRWLHTQRIRHAQELLETTDATVDTIGAATGMGTAPTLRRHFHRSGRPTRHLPPRFPSLRRGHSPEGCSLKGHPGPGGHGTLPHIDGIAADRPYPCSRPHT